MGSVLNGACDNGWCYSPNGSERYHVCAFVYSFVLETSGDIIAASLLA
jgi:hypothetical protein